MTPKMTGSSEGLGGLVALEDARVSGVALIAAADARRRHRRRVVRDHAVHQAGPGPRVLDLVRRARDRLARGFAVLLDPDRPGAREGHALPAADHGALCDR